MTATTSGGRTSHSPTQCVDILRRVIESQSLRFATELQLQNQLEVILKDRFGDNIQREFRLSKKDRPDFFWVCNGIAIEVKDRIGRSDIHRQLESYSQYDLVKQLVLIIPRINSIPTELNGKPVHVIEIWKQMI